MTVRAREVGYTLSNYEIITQLSLYTANAAPVAQGATYPLTTYTPLALTLGASDAESQTLTYTITVPPVHGTLTGTGASRTYTPTGGTCQPDRVAFTVTDAGTLVSNTAWVALVVTGVNDPPSFTPGPAQQVLPNSGTHTVTGWATNLSPGPPDESTQTLNFTVTNDHPAYFSEQPALDGNGTLTYTLATGQSGVATLTVTLQDNGGNDNGGIDTSPAYTTTITVTTPPTVTLTTPFNGEYIGNGITFSLIATAVDPDGTVAKVSFYQDGHFLHDDPTAPYTYSWTTPPTPGPYVLSAIATDNLGAQSLVAQCQVNVVIEEKSTYLQLTPAGYPVPVNAPVLFSATSAGFTNPTYRFYVTYTSGQTSVLVNLSSPLYGSASTCTWTPQLGERYTAGVQVREAGYTQVNYEALMTLNYLVTNAAPYGTPQTLPVRRNVATAVTLTGTDPESQPLTYTVAAVPTHGTLTGTAPTLTYTPATDYVGTDTFTYQVSDGQFTGDPVTITLNVFNHAPVANNQSLSTLKNIALPFTLTATDADNDTLTFALVTQPTHGTLSGTAPNLTYTPAINYTGTDSFTFTANDGYATSTPATISVTVCGEALVSAALDDTPGNDESWGTVMSADSRYVAFASDATNLVTGDPTGFTEIYVADRNTGTVTRVSVTGDGTPAYGDCWEPTISANGRYIAFVSDAQNLVTANTNGVPTIYVHDRQTGTTTLASWKPDGTLPDGPCWGASLSADGTWLAFYSDAATFRTDATATSGLYAKNLVTGDLQVLVAFHQGDQLGCGTAISNDGSTIAFTAQDPALTPTDTSAYRKVFTIARQSLSITCCSPAMTGMVDGDSWDPSLSADGQHIAFVSEATNLVANDANGKCDVFVRDVAAHTTQRLATPDGNGDCWEAQMSGNGRYVVFTSEADNLVPDTNGSADVFRADLQTGALVRISTPQSAADSWDIAVSADGLTTAFVGIVEDVREVYVNTVAQP